MNKRLQQILKVRVASTFFIVLALAVFAFIWFSNSVERKKRYLRRIEGALTQSGENYDRPASFPVPAVLSDKGGNVLWFNAAPENWKNYCAKMSIKTSAGKRCHQ